MSSLSFHLRPAPSIAALACALVLPLCTAVASAEPPPTAKAVVSPRAPADAQREAMLQILADPSVSERRVWFAVGPGDAEALALEKALRSVFEQAGWTVSTRTITGMVLKPGVSMLAAEEESPEWVGVVQQALDASGLTVKYGSGYRPYYQEMKQKNPAWVGVPIEADQHFVVVLGPAPKS